ncbi:MAG: hypothetical protein JXM70_20565 [Pirellulales bacterium]|nr:hypothetical protein [Pirellulales bacterium]
MATVILFGSIPSELAAPYELGFFEWVVSLWKWWGIALLILIVFARFGPKQNYDKETSISSILHWKNFPGNWREWCILFLAVTFYLLFLLTIGFIALYGSPDG